MDTTYAIGGKLGELPPHGGVKGVGVLDMLRAEGLEPVSRGMPGVTNEVVDVKVPPRLGLWPTLAVPDGIVVRALLAIRTGRVIHRLA